MRCVLAVCAALLVSFSAGTLAAPAHAEEYDLFGSLFSNPSDIFHQASSPPHQQRIAVEHATGNILIANIQDDRIDVYRPSAYGGKFLTSFGAGEVIDPFGIAIDQATGAVYVSDAGNGRIVRYGVAPGTPPVYTLDSGFTGPAAGGADGEIGNFAASLAIDASAGRLLVADPGNNRVKRFTLAGAYDNLAFDGADAPAAHPGDTDGHFTGLLDLAVDSTGDIVVIDSLGDIANSAGDSRVLRFSSAGAYEDQIGPSLSRPATVGIRPTDDEVFVTWNQDSVNAFCPDCTPKIAIFTSADIPDGSITFSTNSTDGGLLYAVTTGVALDDGPLGRLYLATDVDRSSENGKWGIWSVQALTPPTSPLVSDEQASALRPTSATVTAGLYTGRGQTTYHFEYGVVGQGFTQSTPSDSRNSFQSVGVKAYLTGLQPRTTYQFRLVADNGAQTVGDTATFTTALPYPVVSLGAATGVTRDVATVHGTIDTLDLSGRYGFVVAEVGGPQHVSVPLGDLSAVDGPVAVSAQVPGLLAGKTYRVGLYAKTAAGLTFADPVTFTTAAGPSFVPVPPAPPAAGSVYGCDAPRLDAVPGVVRPGQQITLSGSDLGVAGTVSAGVDRLDTTTYSSSAIGLTVPQSAKGKLAVVVDCGRSSNTITLAIASVALTAKASVSGSTATVRVQVSGAGRVTASGTHLKSATKAVSGAGAVTLKVTLSKSGKAALKRAKSKRLTVTIRLRYAPAGAAVQTITRTVTFKRGAAR